MPPIMGAGAFVMASYTQIPYTQIVLVAWPGAEVLHWGGCIAFVLIFLWDRRRSHKPEIQPT